MPTFQELGVKIGDSVSFPVRGEERHTTTIVGPKDFPHSHDVLLAPPAPKGGNLYLYDTVTGKRHDIEFRGGREIEQTPGESEVRVQSIYYGYTLFERA